MINSLIYLNRSLHCTALGDGLDSFIQTGRMSLEIQFSQLLPMSSWSLCVLENVFSLSGSNCNVQTPNANPIWAVCI